ncbi:UvrD-helicase domain-containing protein [Bacillus sp. V3B]|uniref:RNA polymerase recycling motor HelD n=1 Tax=Bacillus sp. V3B TaxID=2804915 RepID=UPI00210F11EB|nr:RNA polymerase recycling motor HelD [Bacillus sp. V3B]MCQ6276123.1 UvrD-helicase domain-containing protein [Bacillus sp. V3B]
MGEEQKNINEEQQRIDRVIVEIDHIMKRLQIHGKGVKSDTLELRKTFWQDVTVNLDEPDDVVETFTSIKQQAELLSERERSHGQIHTQLKILTKLKESPYFGRIDFKEQGEKVAESIYLGIASVMDRNEEQFLIYDWRAPISSLYYDFPPGPAAYGTPEGEISGKMELKRQYIIRNGNIVSMFDTGITIGDELLQEVLGHNASTQMKSIVATIQREQNQIIRNEKSKLLVVQGVAGSGKTSAALQRVAYLLYRNRHTLSSENIMLFSPNSLFNSYVSTVLPELGEENMKQTTFQEYLDRQLGAQYKVEDPFSQLEFLLNEEEKSIYYRTRMASIRFKGSLQFKSYIDQFLDSIDLGGLYFKDIIFRSTVIVSKMDILDQFYQLDSSFSIPNRIQMVQDWIIKQLRRQAKKELRKSWVEEEIQFLEKEDYLEAYNAHKKKYEHQNETFDDFEQEQKFLMKQVVNREMKPLIKSVKRLRFIDLKKIYRQLFAEKPDKGYNDPLEWSRICQISLTALEKNILPYEDATPLLYLKDRIEGKKANLSLRYVFIDEAQDYSPFQFAYLKELFPYSKMTLLGDMNQAIFLHSKEMVSIFEVDSEKEKETIVLTRSYRSTKQIVEFTRGLTIAGERIEPFNRDGKKPTLTRVNNAVEWKKKVQKRIRELREFGYQTIAIIGKTASETKFAFEMLSDEIDGFLMEKGSIHYEKGIVFIPAYLAKGIEFDAVIMYNASQQNFGRELERELFYTACTRAMHELHLFSLGEESMFISRQPKETYEVLKEEQSF